jgi:hypothetical protein
VEKVGKDPFNCVPAAVAHFVNTMSTLNLHRPWRPNPHRVEPLPGYPHNPHALLLRRFLDLLNSVEGRAWISTLPLPEQTSYTGVRTHLEAVLAVGYLIATIHQEQQ